MLQVSGIPVAWVHLQQEVALEGIQSPTPSSPTGATPMVSWSRRAEHPIITGQGITMESHAWWEEASRRRWQTRQDTHRGLFIQQLRPTQNLQPRIKLKLFGHSGSGKTTLVESLKCGLLRSFFRRRRPRLSSTSSSRFPPSPLASKPAVRENLGSIGRPFVCMSCHGDGVFSQNSERGAQCRDSRASAVVGSGEEAASGSLGPAVSATSPARPDIPARTTG
ncbi:hypothetical protein P7K49_000615 [Saguinus oedipus]|uniref:Uncharacterized protein n=1 Tax=Saguinus oedipus TaxID=9490 RepID=A0ABQ9WDX6_SAGOE|nr:hypothetical protein P7K49_000615 [Saguinus oedipus]